MTRKQDEQLELIPSAGPVDDRVSIPAPEPVVPLPTSFEDSASVGWCSGIPNLDGMLRFVHIIRSPTDPDRLSRKQRQASADSYDRWKTDLAGEPSEWALKIVELLSDGEIRTFNAIVLELTGLRYTADVAIGKSPEKGLWRAVESGELEYTPQAPVLFRLAK